MNTSMNDERMIEGDKHVFSVCDTCGEWMLYGGDLLEDARTEDRWDKALDSLGHTLTVYVATDADQKDGRCGVCGFAGFSDFHDTIVTVL